jgi:hypothetical protein
MAKKSKRFMSVFDWSQLKNGQKMAKKCYKEPQIELTAQFPQ